ncbi:aldolase catalytic domain-containing protein [Rhabdothermincola sediminis]|uniref:aldolase catalytic domain-containing protein n=1 Tax=Rhabdothermincola sediminis TaxID=2751370 RepID=UPI001AA0AA49|nr:aldolase catalytic domain-containing protein [Rhabdothermincola sediminis]
MAFDPTRLQVLDCTLRDGGYYNAWDFRPSLVERYLAAVDAAGVDVVEIGFRSYPQPKFLGPFAYSTDELLSGLKLPKATIGVMANASDLLSRGGPAPEAVDALFRPADLSPVSLVRLAAHLHEVSGCQPIVERLRELGYRVGLNLMQVSRSSGEQLTQLAATCEAWGSVEVLYFADSLGNMTAADIAACITALSAGWSGPLGIHAHDNRARALTNTLAAAELGATWLDATVLGMGRGAGNVRTDFLLFELAQMGCDRYRPEALLPVVLEDFGRLQEQYGWGTNLLYLMSAAYDIHPTYVQQMIGDGRYETADIVAALKNLRTLEGHSFSTERLGQAVAASGDEGTGTWSADGWLTGRDVLVIGAGPSAELHREELNRFIARERPAVLCLNTTSTVVSDEMVSAFVACNPSRIMLESSRLAGLRRPLLAPRPTIDALVGGERLDSVEVLDYGLRVEAGRFDIGSSGCVLPARLAVAYAIAAATAGGARRILLAGFDGYRAGDPRQEEMVEVLRAYEESGRVVPLIAITPSTYPVQQSSVYAPTI